MFNSMGSTRDGHEDHFIDTGSGAEANFSCERLLLQLKLISRIIAAVGAERELTN
jgi:hypothetical protein